MSAIGVLWVFGLVSVCVFHSFKLLGFGGSRIESDATVLFP